MAKLDAESRLVAEDGMLYAHATSTCLILHNIGLGQPPDDDAGSTRAGATKV
jgi:hypothetical protein